MTYLFTAIFTDGTFVAQTPEDISTHTEGRNAFFDVLQRIHDVATFTLTGNGNTFMVDLSDGSFTVNGAKHLPQGADITFPVNTAYRLVYFKRNKLVIAPGESVVDHAITYYCGWQCTVEGKNHQRTMAVI